MLFTTTIFGIVVLHELGHALTAAHYGIRTRDITLYPIGGVASLERIPENPRQEFLVALAGPAVNVALALALAAILGALHLPIGVENVRVVGGSFLAKLMWVNVSLALFNLLPAFPMDGGRVLRAALAFKVGHERATVIAARVGQAMALGFGLVGMFGNPMLLFIALFVWSGAHGEASFVRLRSLMHDVSVRQAMTREPLLLSPTDTLSDVIDAIVARGHHAFPVVRDGRVVGVVTKSSVLEALAEVRPSSPVLAAMEDRFAVADPSEMLDAAFARLERQGGNAIVVMRDGAVVGMVTRHNVGELLTMRLAEGVRA
jgi:Zn-dependent protease